MLWWWILQLKSKNVKAQWNAARKLGASQDVRAIDPLAEALKGDDYLAARAAEALGKIEDIRSLPPLIEALSRSGSAVKNASRGSLVKLAPLFREHMGEIFSASASSMPLDKLVDPSFNCAAMQIAQVLEQIAWKSNIPEQRILFALVTGRFRDAAKEKEALEALSSLLDHSNVHIRETVANAITLEYSNLPPEVSSKLGEVMRQKKEKEEREAAYDRQRAEEAAERQKKEAAELETLSENDMVAVLAQLCHAYQTNDRSSIGSLEKKATAIGIMLDSRGGIVKMRQIFSSLNKMPGSRTLEMHWDGIGEWRG